MVTHGGTVTVNEAEFIKNWRNTVKTIALFVLHFWI